MINFFRGNDYFFCGIIMLFPISTVHNHFFFLDTCENDRSLYYTIISTCWIGAQKQTLVQETDQLETDKLETDKLETDQLETDQLETKYLEVGGVGGLTILVKQVTSVTKL